jgi:hypothetical protein
LRAPDEQTNLAAWTPSGVSHEGHLRLTLLAAASGESGTCTRLDAFAIII